MKNKISRFGKFLSGMVMPNIGAFIAWGFLTALFIADGWLPNEKLASMVSPMLAYLLPILIAAQGGFMVAGERGRIIGAIAVIGCICGSSYTMLMGAMVMGPAAGWVIRKFDKAVDGKIPAGFEMLVNNFSVGILGLILAIIGYYVVGPVMTVVLQALSAGANFLVQHSLLPLISIFVEPAKVLFLNNAINHGIFSPIGAEQVAVSGRSIMYMLETNPGPGLGVLLAYCFFCKDNTTRQSAPGAVIIHLLGGIHEIYFPYILMNPLVILGPMVGNAAAILFYSVMGAGLFGPPSPGSIIAFLAMAPQDSMLTAALGVILSAGISFLICAPIVRRGSNKNLEEATREMEEMKAQAKGGQKPTGEVNKIVFACDAGMGSSAMGATRFRKRVQQMRPDIIVTNTSVDTIPGDADIVVCQEILADRARNCAPNAALITIGNFLADPALDNLYALLTGEQKDEPGVLVKEGIRLDLPSVDKETAIRTAGELLCSLGYVDGDYADAMLQREKLTTTYMGMGVAIPHGTSEKKETVKKTGVVMLQYPEGVDFGDEKAYLIFGIAGVGDEHLELLSHICDILEEEETLETMKSTKDIDYLLSKLN